jgi:hypothetical protein
VKNKTNGAIEDYTRNKDWYKRPGGMIIAFIIWPVFLIWLMWQSKKFPKWAKISITVFVAIVAIGAASSEESSNQTSKNDKPAQISEQEQAANVEKTVDDLNKIAEALKAKVDKYAPVYCQNHKNVHMRNDQNLINGGWPTFDGRRNWTQEECRTIISKLMDITTEDRISQISEGRKIGVGMKSVEVIYSLGYPDDVSSTTNSYGTGEQWVYGSPIYDGHYVYLDNGVVTSYQQ